MRQALIIQAKKISLLINIVFWGMFLQVLFLPNKPTHADDAALRQWEEKKEAEIKNTSVSNGSMQNDGWEIQQDNEFFYSSFGKLKIDKFTKCCSQFLDVIHKNSQFSNAKKVSFVEGDLNRDGAQDFIALIEDESFCQNDLCPIGLYVQNNQHAYDEYAGPYIKGRNIAFAGSKTNDFYDIVFKRNGIGYCLWKWTEGIKQDFMCSFGNSTHEDHRK